MTPPFCLTICSACAFALLAACAPPPPPADGPGGAPAAALTTFGSDEAFARFQQQMEQDGPVRADSALSAATAAEGLATTRIGEPATVQRSQDRPPQGEPVDATRTAGVHEAGIVKATRDHLVIVRRKRVETVRIADGALETVSGVSAYAAEESTNEQAIDGIFVAGGVVLVTGYNPARRVVEVGLVSIDEAGGLRPRATYQLRAGGEGRDPAVRMVNGRLVVYTPAGVRASDRYGIAPALPAVRRWRRNVLDTAWQPLAQAAGIYRPAGPMRADDEGTLHAVTVCEPAANVLRCRSTVVLAPREAAHHVSPTAVYVWAGQGRGGGEPGAPAGSVLYRFPLDGAAPTALRVAGRPTDAFSFNETPDGQLHVLVRADGGTAAWNRPAEQGDVALLRVPLSALGDGTGAAGAEAYHPLPGAGTGTFHNRFVGGWVLYGTEAETGGRRQPGRAFAARRDGSGAPVPLPLAGSLVALEPMSAGALVVTGSPDSLHYLPVRLAAGAQPGEPFARARRWSGEVGAHAAFHDAGSDGMAGVALSGRGPTISALFLRDEGVHLREAGELSAPPPEVDCPTCGELFFARPVFVRGRIFALLADEVVEGIREGGRVRELRRIRLVGPPSLSLPPGFADAVPPPGQVQPPPPGGQWIFLGEDHHGRVSLDARSIRGRRGGVRSVIFMVDSKQAPHWEGLRYDRALWTLEIDCARGMTRYRGGSVYLQGVFVTRIEPEPWDRWETPNFHEARAMRYVCERAR
jgi:hypothetical protein